MSALCQKQTFCAVVKSPYWITSSAATRSVCGIVMPSALAVLRLIISKYFTGICTGSSDGFAPRRISFTYWAEPIHEVLQGNIHDSGLQFSETREDRTRPEAIH